MACSSRSWASGWPARTSPRMAERSSGSSAAIRPSPDFWENRPRGSTEIVAYLGDGGKLVNRTGQPKEGRSVSPDCHAEPRAQLGPAVLAFGPDPVAAAARAVRQEADRISFS